MSKTSADIMLEFLQSHPVAHLATVNSEGKPNGATIFYKVDDTLNFYFITKSDTHKYKNMQDNAYVALTITDNESLRTVQVNGKAKLLDASMVQLTDAIAQLEELHFGESPGWQAPISRVKKGEYKFVKVVPYWVRSTNFKEWDNIIDFQQVEF